jgi:hypothetical protein
MTRYRIEIEAKNESELEVALTDGRWKPEIVPELPTRFIMHVGGSRFEADISEGAGQIVSNLHYDETAWEREFGPSWSAFHRYEGAIDVLEAFILAAACAGINVLSSEFHDALQTTLDALGNAG